jgi:hypothetical protein
MSNEALWKQAEEIKGDCGYKSRRITLGSQVYVLFIQEGYTVMSPEGSFVGVFATPARPFNDPDGVRQKVDDESDESMWDWAENEARQHYEQHRSTEP